MNHKGTKELTQKEVEIMKKEEISVKDILHPGYKNCMVCKTEPNIPGMWVCADCYDKKV